MKFDNLRALREKRRLTQADLAAVLGCSQVCYSRYEHGLRDLSTTSLIRLADFYEVSVDYLLGRSTNPKRRF